MPDSEEAEEKILMLLAGSWQIKDEKAASFKLHATRNTIYTINFLAA
jgi:hypothetical protein